MGLGFAALVASGLVLVVLVVVVVVLGLAMQPTRFGRTAWKAWGACW